MSKIKVMSPLLANKIAAGEVVEKCASVIKELVENAIDAGSTQIKVSLKGGGLEEMRVLDNGSGMDRDDALLSFERHATSKIYKDDDLFFIETLGFRGEALASIASVSEVIMNTSNGEEGTHIHIKGGEVLEVSDAQARKGTEIIVKNLFFNTPARLKYLKTEATELNNIIRYIEKLSLSKPNIAFSLDNNDRVLIKTSGKDNLLKTIHEIYGVSVSSNMLEIKNSNNDFEISGYVSKPSILKKNRNHLNTFVNGRIIRNYEINKAIDDAYNTYKHDGFYPITVLNIYADPTLVDVNIHPTKQDVKMSKMEDLTTLLYDTIKEALYKNFLVPDMVIEKNSYVKEALDIKEDGNQVQLELDLSSSSEVVKNEEVKKLNLYPVGQALGTYIIAEDKDNLYIIDQHAAHERINYETITKKFKEEDVSITELLVPFQIELAKSDYEAFMEKKGVLEDLGFKIEEYGINTIAIKAHPTWLKFNYEGDNLKYIVDLVIENKNFSKEKFVDSLAKMASCRMSVKAGDHLSIDEMDKLLKDLVKCDNPYNCCHGRPSIMKYNSYELEKMFRRVI